MEPGPPHDSVEAARASAAVERALFGSAEPVVLGRFRVLDPIGRGGMGVVYSAWDPQLQRRVALKLVRPERDSDESRRRLLAEARAVARLAHPNVVAIHEVGQAGARVFIAMEHIDGVPLSELGASAVGLAACLDAFAQAGRGLAAAHAAGVIHRDFKPSNALVSREADGRVRVRVVDFGLARPGAVPESEESLAELDDATSTRTGAVLGTPRYMSPEQLEGQPVDARSDQFNFCVALFEALYDRPPFDADDLESRRRSVLAGPVVPPGRAVPRRIEAALRRGLAVRPEDRFADMNALLAALDRSGSRRRRWLAGAVAAGGLALGAVAIGRSAPPPCAELELPWSRGPGVLGPGVVERIEASGLPSAGSLAASTERALAERGARWVEARRSVCEATRVRGSQSETLLDLRMACLDRGRMEAEAVLRRAGADDEGLGRVLDAIARLDDPEACTRMTAELGVAPPEDPERRRELDALMRESAESQAEFLLSRWSQGRERAEQVLVRARAYGEPRLVAASLGRLAAFEARVGDPAQARRWSEEAMTTAVAADQTDVAATVAGSLVWIDGYLLDEHEQAERDGALALAWLDASGADDERVAAVLDNLGTNAYAMQRYELAEQRHRRALALSRSEAARIRVRVNLAAAIVAGRSPEAIAERDRLLDEVLPLAEARYGPDNAMVAAILHNRWVDAAEHGRCDEAVPRLRRALEIKTLNYGESGLPLTSTLGALAECDREVGEVERSVERRRRAVAIVEARLGPRSPRLLRSLEGLSYSLVEAGRLDEAEAVLDRADELQREHHGDHDPFGFGLVVNRASLRAARGEHAEALELLDRALALAAEAEPESASLGTIELVRARSLAELGRREAAEEAARRALERLEARGGLPSQRDEAARILERLGASP